VVLLVEDDDALRRFTARLLERAGYRVIQARTGAEALEAAPGEDVRALVTDVVMPRMSGHELAQQLLAGNPGLAVIYTSGYTEDTMARHGIDRERVAFLQKPFQSSQLVDALGRALAAAGTP
jgi:DNA-binding NtrC family response regulator